MFPSVSPLFLHWKGPKSTAKLNGGSHGQICPPPGSATVLKKHYQPNFEEEFSYHRLYLYCLFHTQIDAKHNWSYDTSKGENWPYGLSSPLAIQHYKWNLLRTSAYTLNPEQVGRTKGWFNERTVIVISVTNTTNTPFLTMKLIQDRITE